MTIEVQSPPRAPRAEFLPLRDYALIGDAHGAALVSRDGVIDWCVSPEIGSPPFFLRLLDPDKGGYFGIQPDSDFTVLEHVYLPGTNIVRTVFQTAEGQLELLDGFDVGQTPGAEGRPGRALSRVAARGSLPGGNRETLPVNSGANRISVWGAPEVQGEPMWP